MELFERRDDGYLPVVVASEKKNDDAYGNVSLWSFIEYSPEDVSHRVHADIAMSRFS